MTKLVLIFFVAFLACCQRKVHDETIEVVLDKNLISIISKLCNGEECKQCENEIFIDRISPDSTRFTIRIGGYKVKHLPRPYPVMKTIVNGVEFNVYTGAEQYLSVSGVFKNAISKDPPYSCSEEISTIIEKNGIYVLKNYGGEPFNYYPDHLIPDTLKFLPPDGKVGH